MLGKKPNQNKRHFRSEWVTGVQDRSSGLLFGAASADAPRLTQERRARADSGALASCLGAPVCLAIRLD